MNHKICINCTVKYTLQWPLNAYYPYWYLPNIQNKLPENPESPIVAWYLNKGNITTQYGCMGPRPAFRHAWFIRNIGSHWQRAELLKSDILNNKNCTPIFQVETFYPKKCVYVQTSMRQNSIYSNIQV